MQSRPNSLLHNIRPKLGADQIRAHILPAALYGTGRSSSGFVGRGGGGVGVGLRALELPDYVAVVFFGGATQEFEEDDEEDDGDAGAGEHAVGGYVP